MEVSREGWRNFAMDRNNEDAVVYNTIEPEIISPPSLMVIGDN